MQEVTEQPVTLTQRAIIDAGKNSLTPGAEISPGMIEPTVSHTFNFAVSIAFLDLSI